MRRQGGWRTNSIDAACISSIADGSGESRNDNTVSVKCAAPGPTP